MPRFSLFVEKNKRQPEVKIQELDKTISGCIF